MSFLLVRNDRVAIGDAKKGLFAKALIVKVSLGDKGYNEQFLFLFFPNDAGKSIFP